MTSQNSEKNSRSSSPAITKSKNCTVSQSVLMKERNQNQINNKNVLLLNRMPVAANCNVKNSNFVHLNPTTSANILTRKANLTQLIKSGRESFFNSDIEVIDDYDVSSEQEKRSHSDTKNPSKGFLKKETPFLQIFDGNVIISQELSIEEVQSLLIQINSKLQNQKSVNSADFPNLSFSKEENSDVEIILDDEDDLETDNKNSVAPNEIADLLVTCKTGKWIGQSVDSENRKVVVKPVGVNDGIGKTFCRPSTSAESNLLISFKALGDRNGGGSEFEHDYTNSSRNYNNIYDKSNRSNNCNSLNNNNKNSKGKYQSTENGNSKKDDPMVEHVLIENVDSELMQIELIERGSVSTSASNVSSSSAAAKDARNSIGESSGDNSHENERENKRSTNYRNRTNSRKPYSKGHIYGHYGFEHRHRTTMNYQHQRVLHQSLSTGVLNHHSYQSSIPAYGNGEPIKLPDNLESVPKAEHFPTQRHRWNTNEEIAAILISFDRHNDWQSKEVKIRPKSGSMLLYSRKKVRYRRDGYCWKKRKDGKTTREDHMKLKVQGTECIYGCYVHSAILPTFHRRCYWLLQNPDIVLVHYLNVPYPDDNKLAVLAPSLALWGDKKEWTKEELISQLKPMFYSEEERDLNNELEISTAETVDAIVTQLMEKQRAARAATLTKQLECGCPDSTCADSKTCSHPMRRITAANVKQESSARILQVDSNNQVSSTTGSGMLLTSSGTNGSNSTTIHHRATRSDRLHHGVQAHSSPLVLSLSQIHGGGGVSLSHIQGGTNLLILNNPPTTSPGHPPTSVAMVTNFKCATSAAPPIALQQPPLKQYHHPRNKVILKQESMDTNPLSCCRMSTSSNGHQHKIDESNGSSSSLITANVATFENTVFSRDKHDVGKGLNSAPVTPTKCMETCDNSDDTILILNSSDANRENSVSSVVSGSSFYNETLDLSQEDIQKTLSANMPLTELGSHRKSSHSKSPSPSATVLHSDVMVSEINPIELMDSPPTVVDDDVFVNLDAFDMLSDFPELEVLDHSGNSETVLVQNAQESNQDGNIKGTKNESSPSSSSNLRSNLREGSASITDYSPEWAYPEGGVKVLVTGPWYSSTSTYTVLFDSFPVPTSLVQSGVLRCFCPAHEVGLATVQVACEGFVISNSVMFEYKRPPSEDSIKLKEPKLEENENLLKFTLLQRLEAVDERLQIKQEPGGGDLSDSAGMYHQCTNFEERIVNYCQDMTSRQWRLGDESSPNWTSDFRGMTLLHLAASLGYTRLVCALLHWRAENSSLLLETEIDALSQDDEGFTPLMWACGRGHRETALVLYRWNHMALHIHNSSHQTALAYARAKGQEALANEIEKLEETREEANMTVLTSTSNNLDRLSQSDITPNLSPSCSMISLNSSKSHDGIFLRPDPVAKSDIGRFKNTSVGLNFNSQRSTSPSPTLGLADGREPHQLVKRPSVDSGINLGSCQSDSFSSLRSFSKYKSSGNGETPKLSRFDRSMSLPSSAICNSYESDGRRMDFALCEVTAAGPSSNSPTNDVESLSEDDVEVNDGHVGEQEVRVLTLAEQIIAAIPERIKNESEEMQLDASPPRESSHASDALSDSLMEPLLDEPSSSYRPTEFNFEFSDHNYRYYDVGTPSSSLSPASSSLQSPSPGFPLDSPSPPPTTQDFCEFFHASGSIFEKDFSNLTLSDREQRELYEAAKIIQKAYRSYKGRKKSEEDKERAAAVLIQNYYRRYKQYAYFKQVTHAAMVIQNGYRSYCEHKRFKKSQEAAVCIQNYYRHYKEQGESRRGSRETTPSAGLKRTYSQRRQHQAACKIQQFMRQSKNKLQKERALAAEKERQDARSFSQDVRRKSPSPDSSDPNNRCCDKNLDNDGS